MVYFANTDVELIQWVYILKKDGGDCEQVILSL